MEAGKGPCSEPRFRTTLSLGPERSTLGTALPVGVWNARVKFEVGGPGKGAELRNCSGEFADVCDYFSGEGFCLRWQPFHLPLLEAG